MPGRAPAQGGQPRQPFGPQLKAALVQAAPLFSAMAAGYSSGRGPYAYLDQGIAGMQAMQKQKRDEEAAAAAAAAFGGLVPGGMGPAGAPASSTSGGGSVAPVTFDKAAPQYIADDAMAALGKEPLSMEGRIREGLKARGMPEHVANGFIANFKDESNLNPGINEAAPVVPGSRGGFGLAQWTGPRRKALEAFAASTGRPVDDLNVQLDFLMQELSGSEAGAAGAIMSAKNAPEAAAAIVNSFLRPAEEHRSRREAAYLGMEGGAPSVADPLADPYVQKLMGVMAMPGLTDEQRSVVQLQLQTRMGQLSAPDPNAEEDRARERRARDAELLGYGRGTPEWNQYVVTGEQPKPASPLEVGGVLLDPTGQNVLFDSREPPKPEAPTTKNVKLADGSDVMVQWNPETQVWDAAPIPEGGTTGAGKKLTENQSKLTLFQTLQTETAPVLLELEKQFDPANLKDPALSSVPIAGNYFTSPEYQMYTTAASAWAEGALRISTGAAATQPEIDRLVKTYFAQPGDTPQTVAFKASMRQMYDRAVNNALGKPNGDGSLMLPSDFAAVVGDQTGAPAPSSAQPGGVLKFDANGNIIP